MRLFLAILFEDPYFISLQQQIDRKSAVFTFPHSFHITLKFLGDVDDVDDVKEQMKRISFSPFSVSLSEIGAFPSLQRVNVIWVGINDQGETSALQKKIDDLLKDKFPDNHPFHPHITLARVKFVKEKEKLQQNIKTISVEKKRFDVHEFILFESILTPQGPVYTVVERYPARSFLNRRCGSLLL